MDSNLKKKILIVEDDQFLREFYQELLVGEGYQVDTASDGEEGLLKITSQPHDLVLLDIMLPKKDGIQILQDLKAGSDKFKPIILILTNLGHDAIIKNCFDLGAKGYLIKSALNPPEILSEIQSYLNKS